MFADFALTTTKMALQIDPSRDANFETDIKILRKSRLTRSSEFTTMLLAAERFQRDAKLASLTRKDQNQLAQQTEDAQFFRILLRMMMEVNRASGLKQRDDLRKVYHWYQINKEVLHCEPHFKGASKQLYKRPELKFSADAIKYYSDPPGKRKNKQVGFLTASQQNSPRGQRSDDTDELKIDTRPTTAPPGLHRPKIHNSLRSPRSGNNITDDASFAVDYINAYLNNKLSPVGPERPSTVMGVIREAQISVQKRKGDDEDDDLEDESARSLVLSLSSESNVSIQEDDAGGMKDKVEDADEDADKPHQEEDGKDGDEDKSDEDQDEADDGAASEDQKETTKMKRKPPISSLVNPVAQVTFEEESYHGGHPPQMKESTLLKIQVDMPRGTAKQEKQPTEAEVKAASLQKWNEYQENQARSLATGDSTPFLDEGGDRVVTTEMPERFTHEVIANFAQESFVSEVGLQMPTNSLASQSLENFFKMTTEHEPKVNQNPIPPKSARSGRRSQEGGETKRVTIVEDAAPDRGTSARGEAASSVPTETVVDLAGPISDQMMIEKQQSGPEVPLGFRKPSSKVTPKRPNTAPATHTMPMVSGSRYGGISPPPNSSRVSSSGGSTPEYTPRNKRGEPIFILPDESDYNVHFRRRDQPPTGNIPFSISRQQTPLIPETNRYKWRDDGYGNMTYRKMYRIQSAPPQRTSLRTAGSTRGGNRPRTASDGANKGRWHSCRACEASIRVPQAASHRITTMHPATVASMVTIKHLGSENRRSRSRMGQKHTGPYPWEEETVAPSGPPSMQYMSISSPAAIKARKNLDGSRTPNQSTESIVPKESLHSPSRESSHPSPLPTQGWFMGDSSSGEPTNVDAQQSDQGGDNSSTMMAHSDRSSNFSDVDLADLTDQTLSPPDTPRTIESGDQAGTGGNIETGDKPNVDLSAITDGEPVEEPGEESRVDSTSETCNEVANDVSESPRLSSDDADVEVHQAAVSESPRSLGGDADRAPDQSSEADLTPRESEEGTIKSVDSEPDRSGSEGKGEDCLSGKGDGQGVAENKQAYMKLTEQHRSDLQQTNPTAATNIPEYLLMMPSVSSKPLTPRSTPNSSRPSTPGSAASPRSNTPTSTRCPRYARSISPSARSVSPGSVGDRLSPSLRSSPRGPGSRGNSRSPSPAPSNTSHTSRQTEKDQAKDRSTDVSSPTDLPGGSSGKQERLESNGPGAGSLGLQSGSKISITAEDAEVSAITDNYDDISIRDDDASDTISITIRTPDSDINFTIQDGDLKMMRDGASPSSGTTSPSITITSTQDRSSVPNILIRRPSSAPGVRSEMGSSSLGLPSDGDLSPRPSSARGRRPVSARRRAQSPKPSLSPSRPTSPRPTSPRFSRPVSPRSKQKGAQWKGRPVPEFGQSNPEAEYEYYQKQQEAKTSVDIQKLFTKSSAREMKKKLEKADRVRQEKRERESFENERAYLEHLWKRDMALYNRNDITFKNWEKEYMTDKLTRDKLRQEKRKMLLQQQAAENRKQMSLLKQIGPSVDMYELFHGQTRGVSKAEMKRAAISIQRFVRGMIVRRMLEKVKKKSRIHAGSFKSFIKYYCGLMKRIARWHGVKKPRIHIDLWEMDEFMDKKRYYEYIFAKRIHPETEMEATDLESYFKECDHYPSKREINNAILGATKKDFTKPNLKLKEREVSETAFMIYVPRGTGLEAKNVRKSTWMNPLVDGEEARKMMGSDSVKDVQLAKSLELVFNSMQERKSQKEWEDKIRIREENARLENLRAEQELEKLKEEKRKADELEKKTKEDTME